MTLDQKHHFRHQYALNSRIVGFILTMNDFDWSLILICILLLLGYLLILLSPYSLSQPTSLSLRGLLQLIRQDSISSPRRRRRPRFVRRAIRRLRRWGLISRPSSRATQTTSSTTQQTEAVSPGQESRQSGPPGTAVPRETSDQPLPQKVGLSQQTEQEQQADATSSLSPSLPPPPPMTLPSTTASLQPADVPERRQTPPIAVAPSSPSLASIFHSLGLSISRFRPSSSPTALPLSSSPSFSSSSSEDEVLLIPLSDDTTSEDDVPMLT